MTRTAVFRAVTLAFLLVGWALAAPAFGRPPTVQNSPGYDARLAESRKAWAEWQAQQQAPKVKVRPDRKKKSPPPQ